MSLVSLDQWGVVEVLSEATLLFVSGGGNNIGCMGDVQPPVGHNTGCITPGGPLQIQVDGTTSGGGRTSSNSICYEVGIPTRSNFTCANSVCPGI